MTRFVERVYEEQLEATGDEAFAGEAAAIAAEMEECIETGCACGGTLAGCDR